MKKALIMAAALTLPFSAVVAAAPASALPCDTPTNWECVNCLQAVAATGQGSSAGCGMHGYGPVAAPGSTGFADCDAMVSAHDRANCWDEHLLGRR